MQNVHKTNMSQIYFCHKTEIANQFSDTISFTAFDKIKKRENILTEKACDICTQNSTAIPIDITKFTTETALS